MTVSASPLEDLTVEFPEISEAELYGLLSFVSKETKYKIRGEKAVFVDIEPNNPANLRVSYLKFTAISPLEKRSASFACHVINHQNPGTRFKGLSFDYRPDFATDEWGSKEVAREVEKAVRKYFQTK